MLAALQSGHCLTPFPVQVEACLNLPEGHQPGAVSAAALAEDVYGPFSGQVTSAARQAFRRAILEAGPRLVEAMFLCEIATASEALSGGLWYVCFHAETGTGLQGMLPVCFSCWVMAGCKAGCLGCLHAGAGACV